MKLLIARHTKIMVVFSIIACALLLGTLTYAQDTSTTTPDPIDRGQINSEQTMKREERVEARTERMEERKVLLEQRVKDRIVNLTSNVIARLTAGASRMENIIVRLGTRIEKLKGMDVDTDAANEKLSEAKEMLTDIRDTLANIDPVQDALNGETPHEKLKTIRTQFKTVRDLLRQTHALLRETVALLKDAVRASETGTGVRDAVQSGNSENSTSTGKKAKTTE